MNQKDFREFFDSVSPDASIVRQTEREIENMMNKNQAQRISLRAACIVLTACLLLTGAALAVTNATGILGRLFRNGEVSSSAKDALVVNAVSAAQNGITLNLDEYLIDQNTMHLGWTVSSAREKDVFYTTAYELIYTNPADEALAENSIGGHYGASASIEVGNGVMARLSKNAPSFSGYADYGYNGSLVSPVRAKVIIRAYETDWALSQVGNVMELYDPESALVMNLENEKKVGVDALNRASIEGYGAFIDARSKYLENGTDLDEASELALTESGVFKPIAEIEVSVIIEPDNAPEARFSLSAPMRVELTDRTVLLKVLTLDSASTIIEYDVITEKDFGEGAILKEGLSYLLFDQNGKPLTSDYMIGMEGGKTQDTPDGKHIFNIIHSGNPIPESVTAITFVPKVNLERRDYEPSNDYFLRIKANTDEENCFTVYLSDQ